MRKTLLILGVGLAVLLGVLLVRTALFSSRQLRVEPAPAVTLDEAGAVERLSGALRFRTVSHADTVQRGSEEFSGLNAYLATAFPRVHATVTREVVSGYSLLYTWSGSDPQLRPMLLMAHLDVVPVEPATEGAWTYPPFEGRVADGFVWGRGALDNKSGVLGILEAVEQLLSEGFEPRRTVLLAFGHDEEVGGTGAVATARLLEERGVTLEAVLDEGGFVTEGILPVPAPVALVGIAEKGYLSLVLTAHGEGGHASMPPRQTAVGILSSAIHRLESRPSPGGLKGPTREMFDYLGPELPLAQRLVFANTWLFRPLIERQLAGSPATDALLRTTTAATMFEGSVKDNVLPVQARAVVNFRIFPGESVESVIERVRRTVADPRIEFARLDDFGNEPSAVSPTDAPSFELLQRTIHQIYPDAVVAPYLVVGATDSRHLGRLTRSIHRFLPVRVTDEDRQRVHGTGERIAVRDYLDGVRFYRQLILNFSR